MSLINWENWYKLNDKEQKYASGKLGYFIGETFGADGDGHGFGDWVTDLVHRDGGNDANQGAAAGIELTKEQGMKVTNAIADIGQGVAGGVLGALGLGDAAAALNTVVDDIQGAASRGSVEQVYGADTVRRCDGLAQVIQGVGWSKTSQAVALLDDPAVRAAAGITGKVNYGAKLRGLYVPLYYLYPSLWSLPSAPPPPTLGGSLGSSLGSAVGSVAGSVIRFK